MLWFNVSEPVSELSVLEFQYILCCGSTQLKPSAKGFNAIFQYILCCGSTGTGSITLYGKNGFQYILCCGSTDTKLSEA